MNESRIRDLRTPLARARGLGSARSGVGHFWWQRATAIALALLVPWLVWLLVSLVGADLETARAAIARPGSAVLLAVFVLALFWHAKLGLQVVIEDYIHTRALEVASQFLVSLACVIGALASLYAIARIAFS
jgi:succinate dehydrogenase / fumarate reductase membrane anchor subunit